MYALFAGQPLALVFSSRTMTALHRTRGDGKHYGCLDVLLPVFAAAVLCLASRVQCSAPTTSCGKYLTDSTFIFPTANDSEPVHCNITLSISTNVYLTFSSVHLLGNDSISVLDKHGNVIVNYTSISDDVVVAAGAFPSLLLVANGSYQGLSGVINASYSTNCTIWFTDVASVPPHGFIDPNVTIDCRYLRRQYQDSTTYSMSFTNFNITNGYLAAVQLSTSKTIANYSGVGRQPDVIQPYSDIALQLFATSPGVTFFGWASSNSKDCANTLTITDTYTVTYPLTLTQNYDNNLNCRWLVKTANPSYKLMINVTRLDLAADLDRLVFGDGSSSRAIASQAVLQHSSTIGNPILMSSDSSIVQFVTDEAGSGKGFTVTFTSLAFGGKYMYNGSLLLQFTGSESCIVSPVSGGCDFYYLLEAEAEKQVVFHPINESLFYGQSLHVFDGASIRDPLLVRFDTTTPMRPVVSSGNHMLIVTQSRNNYSMSFSAIFDQQLQGQSKSSWRSSDSVEFTFWLESVGERAFWSITPSTYMHTNTTASIRLRIDQLDLPLGLVGSVFAGANEVLQLELVDVSQLPLLLDLKSRSGVWCIFKRESNASAVRLPVSFAASYTLVETTVVLTGARGEVTTPNYPGFYPLDGRYNWKLDVPPSQVVHVFFTDFSLASGHQLLAYTLPTEANDTNWNSLIAWNGTVTPSDFIYRNRNANETVAIGFYLDSSWAHNSRPSVATGFRLNYELLECGGNVSNASALGTPGYPQAINQSLVCLWIIDAPMMADNSGSVNILNYTLNFVGDANDTDVEIRDGGSYDAPIVSVPHLSNHPVNMLSTRNRLWIKYNFTAQASTSNVSQSGVALHLSYFLQSCNVSDQCDDQLCIQASWRCDGIPHCRDGKDEQGCIPGGNPTAAPQLQGVAYWVLGVSIGGALLLGVALALFAPRIYRRCRYRNYGELRDMMAPVPT